MSNGTVNKAIIIGRLGKDPEVKTLGNGNTVANLSMATCEKWKDGDGQQQERTEWHRVVVWGKLAELASQYLHKGSRVYAEGKIQTRKYQATDGSDRYVTEVVAFNMTFMDSKKDGEGQQQQNRQQPTNSTQQRNDNHVPPPYDCGDDGIPF